MFLISFMKGIFDFIKSIESNINSTSRFSNVQVKEILQNAKKNNVEFFYPLAKIKSLSAFDMSYILSSIDLDAKKVEIIERAVKMYNENEFNGQGQTISDYIFKVAANINLLSEANLDVFKELAQCKSDIYDFTRALRNPARYINHQKQNQSKFCFSTVLIDE